MPTWEARFSPETIKALAVYIHANAGGAAEPVAPAAPAEPGEGVAAGATGR